MPVSFDGFLDMRGDDRRGIDHGVAGNLRFLLGASGNPDCGQSERGFRRFNALNVFFRIAGIHRQQATHHHRSASHFHALEDNGIVAGFQLQVVANM